MPEVAAGDLVAVMSAGAYGAVQAGTYNSRLLIPEVLAKGEEYAVVRPRPTYDGIDWARHTSALVGVRVDEVGTGKRRPNAGPKIALYWHQLLSDSEY